MPQEEDSNEIAIGNQLFLTFSESIHNIVSLYISNLEDYSCFQCISNESKNLFDVQPRNNFAENLPV